MFWLGWLIASGPAAAMTMEELVVHSSPGKQLRASIPVSLQGEERLAELQVTLATPEEYAGLQLERPAFLDGMRIGLLATGERSAHIQLFAEQPWQGEEAWLVLHAYWPQGKESRQFRLAQVKREREPAESAYRFVEVTGNDTLDAIAMRLSEGSNRSYLHMMYALFLANPEAFYRGNMNNLKRGARLRVPSGKELFELKDAEVFGAIRRQYEEWRQQQETPAEATTQAGAFLAEMSDEQAATLDLKGRPQLLQQQLQQLSAENESIQQRNAELRARLSQLEQQMREVSEQVLDYEPLSKPGQVTTGEEADMMAPDRPTTEPVPEETATASEQQKRSPAGATGLPGGFILLAMVLAVIGGGIVWRYRTPQPGGSS